MTIATGKLGVAGLSTLQDKVKVLNKRAARLGLEPMVIQVVGIEEVKTVMLSGLTRTYFVNSIELNGCPPCINGWSVAARIEFTECGNLVHCAPGAGSVDHAWKTVGNICQHCNTNRRRNDVIVIRHIDGCEIIVGRNCLADYIRSTDAEALIEYANWLGNAGSMISDCDCDEYRGKRVKPTENIETVVAAASICIRKLGWVSGRIAYEQGKGSTKNDVFELLFPPHDRMAFEGWKKWIECNELKVTAYDTDLAGKALEWAKSLDPGQSEYLHNLKVLAQLERVGDDKFGYVVSMIPAYNKAMERETEYAARNASAKNKVWFGEPKKRVKGIKATCKGINSFEGYYGVTTMIRFEVDINDEDKAVLVWFASGDKTEDYNIDEDYTIDATVKDHDDHEKYGKQTKVNRVKAYNN